MQQCAFCGTQWEGSGPCPGCGLEPETPRNDAMFRPPEDGENAPQEALPEFDVEKLLRWEPSPEPETPREEPESPVDAEEPRQADSAQEDTEEKEEQPLKKPLKRWQKFTMAAVAVVVAAALVIRLWPQTAPLPPEPTFFVQDNTLMSLSMGGQPQKMGVYPQGMDTYRDYYLAVSPDHRQTAWVEDGALRVLLEDGGITSFSQSGLYSPKFSQDGKFVYGIVPEGEQTYLYQMEASSGQERKVGQVGGYVYSYWENSSLLVVYRDENQFDIYDPNTLEEIGSLEIVGTVVSLSGDRAYYLENMENREGQMRLCCWQNGKTTVVLENIVNGSFNEGGTCYFECRESTADPIPIADLVNDDMGADGEWLLDRLQQQEITPPQGGSVYYFTGDSLRPMGDDLTLSSFPEKGEKAVVLSSPSYLPVEEVKGTFSLKKLHELMTISSQDAISQYVLENWPQKEAKNFVAVEEKLYQMPQDAPKELDGFRFAGSWVCLYERGEKPSLWIGKLEGDRVAYQSSYFVPEEWLTDFTVTEQGDVYYWEGEYTTALYCNGVQVSAKAVPETFQCTLDGAVYFLEGVSSRNWTLCRVYGGERENLAEKVTEFIPYTREYAVYLQQREDGQSVDLFAWTAGQKAVLVAEQVQLLLSDSTGSSLIDGEWQ